MRWACICLAPFTRYNIIIIRNVGCTKNKKKSPKVANHIGTEQFRKLLPVSQDVLNNMAQHTEDMFKVSKTRE